MGNVTVKLIAALAIIRVVQFPASIVAVGLSIASTAKLSEYDTTDPWTLGRESVPLDTNVGKHTGAVHLQTAAIISLVAALISLIAAACIGYFHLNPRVRRHIVIVLAIDIINSIFILVAWLYSSLYWSRRSCIGKPPATDPTKLALVCRLNAAEIVCNAILWTIWTVALVLSTTLLWLTFHCESNERRAKLAAQASLAADLRLESILQEKERKRKGKQESHAKVSPVDLRAMNLKGCSASP